MTRSRPTRRFPSVVTSLSDVGSTQARFQRSYANLLSSHDDDQGRNHRGVSLEQDGDNANRFYLIAGNGTQWVGTAATTQLQPDVWQHFAVVRQGEKITHYLNGVVSAETQVPAGPLAPATAPWCVGDWARGHRGDASDMLQFVERYQRLVAFELPKQHHVAFARTLDIADYYRRHFPQTPRTVFVSKTDHPLYDMWWLCTWCADGILVPRATIPWDTRPSSVFRVRDTVQPSKDPLSYEYVLIEDQQRQMRFERECPNPIWWFDYTRQEAGPEGSSITYTRTPDVVVRRSAWVRDGDSLTMHLKISSPAEFPDYALCIWGVPAPFSADRTTDRNQRQGLHPRQEHGRRVPPRPVVRPRTRNGAGCQGAVGSVQCSVFSVQFGVARLAYHEYDESTRITELTSFRDDPCHAWLHRFPQLCARLKTEH